MSIFASNINPVRGKTALAEDADRKIPVLIFTGFLGSGKTTVINTFVQNHADQRFAIIENEYGAVSVDHHLIERKEELILEIRNGCLCCHVRGDLIEALKALEGKREQFERIIIETTGLADPSPIAQTFSVDPFVREHFRIQAVVSLIDAKNALGGWETTPEIQAQVAHSDLLLLTKTDLADAAVTEALRRKLAALNPTARQLDVQTDNQEIQTLLDDPSSVKRGWKTLTEAARELSKTHVHTSVHTEVIDADRPLSSEQFETFIRIFLKIWGADVYRMKGILWFQRQEDPFLLQGVQHDIQITRLNLAKLADRESLVRNKSQLVLIATSNEMVKLLRNGIETCSKDEGASPPR